MWCPFTTSLSCPHEHGSGDWLRGRPAIPNILPHLHMGMEKWPPFGMRMPVNTLYRIINVPLKCNGGKLDSGALHARAKGRDHVIVRPLSLIQSPYYTKYDIQCLIVFDVVTTLRCSTLLFNYLTISVKGYTRIYVGIILYHCYYIFFIFLLPLNSNM